MTIICDLTGIITYGKTVFKAGMLVLLVKEPDNEYDENAIRWTWSRWDAWGMWPTAPTR